MDVKVKGQIVTQTCRIPAIHNARDFVIRIGSPASNRLDKRKKIPSFGLRARKDERSVWYNGLFADTDSLRMASTYRIAVAAKVDPLTSYNHKIVQRRCHTAKEPMKTRGQTNKKIERLESSYSLQTTATDPDIFMHGDMELPEDECSNLDVDRSKSQEQKVYLNICDSNRVAPSRRLMRGLTRTSLDMRHHSLGARDVKACSMALQNNVIVQEVNMANNMINPKGCHYLADMLRENVAISKLVLSNNCIESEGLRLLTKSLIEYDRIRMLDLSDNGLNDQDAECIANLIQENELLVDLFLHHNNFTQEGGVLIARALRQNDSLEILDLAWNHIRKKGAIEIGRAIGVNTALVKLDVAWNGLGLEGCRELSKALFLNCSLKELDLTCNRLNDEALHMILGALKKNSTLQRLKVGRNSFTLAAIKTFLRTLKELQNSPLQVLDFQDQCVDAECVEMKRSLQSSRGLVVTHGVIRSTSLQRPVVRDYFNDHSEPMEVLMEFLRLTGTRLSGTESLNANDLKQTIMKSGVPLGSVQLDSIISQLNSPEQHDTDVLDKKIKSHRKLLNTMKKRDQNVLFEDTNLGQMSQNLQNWILFEKQPKLHNKTKSFTLTSTPF